MPRIAKDNQPTPTQLAESIKALELPPQMNTDGTHNIEYYRSLYRRWLEIGIAAASEGRAIPQYDQMRKGISQMCEMDGIDERRLTDTRSDTEILRDALDRLAENPDAVYEESDATLKALKEEMGKAMELADKHIQASMEHAEKLNLAPIDPVVIARLRKKKQALGRWVSRIESALELREWARVEHPKSMDWFWKIRPDWDRERAKMAIEASHPLRFMLYVGRSNISEQGRGNAIYRFGSHHGKFAKTLWEARKGIDFDREGAKYGVFCGSKRYEGVILVSHPGTGKSEFVTHVIGLWFCQNPYKQILVGHAKGDMAAKMVRYMSAMVDPKEPVGRRCLALFPHLTLADHGNTASSMRLQTDQTIKEPTLRAHGMGERISGGNADTIVLDDPVDEKESDSETQRNTTYSRITNTWFTRLRGSSDTFKIIIATIWHPDDAVSRLIKLQREDKAMFRLCIIGAGGPDEYFKPVWPEMYDAAYLKSKWQLNPAAYMTVWGCNPQSKSGQIVSKLALYDCESREHQDFLTTAEKHVSIDPSATNRQKSDKAGVIYAAMGDLRWEAKDEHGKTIHKSDRRLRILKADDLRANQLEIAEHVAAFSMMMPVHQVIVECVGGLSTTADLLENHHGIACYREDPTGKGSKEIRLKRVAVALDDSHRAMGKSAVVEWPATRNQQGDLELVEGVRWLADQVLRFGVASSDDGVDALTQLIKVLRADLGVGEPDVTTAARKSSASGDPRLLRLYEGLREARLARSVEDEDYGFLNEQAPDMGHEYAYSMN